MGALQSSVSSSPACEHPHWQLVERVAGSPFFAKAPKLKAFLFYICENAILGTPQNVTAQLIGTRVFGRESSYIPSEDNIVRVEARELRKRLAAYFEAEAEREAIVIEIPKGSYLPAFVPRTKVAAAPPAASLARQSAEPGSQRVLIYALGAAVVVLAGLLLLQFVRSYRSQQQAAYLASLLEARSANGSFSIYDDLLGTLGLNPNRDALIVLSNPAVMNYTLSDAPVIPAPTRISVPPDFDRTLRDAIGEQDSHYRFLALNISRDSYTGTGEAVAAFHLGRLMNLLCRRIRMTQGRFLSWQDIDRQDLIVLGGPRSNNWRYEKDAKYDFSIDGASIVNAHPLAGEQAVYRQAADTDYAFIEKATTPYQFETVLIAGVSSAGTAAAGQFFADPIKMSDVYRQIKANASGRGFPADWGVLLKVTVRDNLPIDSKVVAVRPAGTALAAKTISPDTKGGRNASR